MLSPQADAGTEEPNRRSVSDLVLDGRRWRCGAGTSSHRGPFRQETGLSVLFEGCRQGYSPYETQVDGLPIWGMSANTLRRPCSAATASAAALIRTQKAAVSTAVNFSMARSLHSGASNRRPCIRISSSSAWRELTALKAGLGRFRCALAPTPSLLGWLGRAFGLSGSL
jgi:hypothetical protein